MEQSVITNTGLNYVISASNQGVLIALKYYLPIYDARIDTDIKKTIVIMCGPPVMYKNSFEELKKNGISADKVYVSVETRMKCGIGKCQHCTMGKKYTCLDGPIFRYDEIINEL